MKKNWKNRLNNASQKPINTSKSFKMKKRKDMDYLILSKSRNLIDMDNTTQ